MVTLIDWANYLVQGTALENKYIVSLLIVAVFAAAGKILLFIYGQYLERFASKTKNKFDDLIFNGAKRPLFFLLVAYGIKLSLLNLSVSNAVEKAADSAMAIVFLYCVLKAFDIVMEIWAITFSRRTKTNVNDVLLPLLHKVTKVIFLIVGLLWVLRVWGIDITPYLAGVGISGIVLGLALQDSLKNIFGGISLLLDKTYRMGDKIKLESGEVGTIYDIGLRSTKIVTFDNEVIYVPNGYLANSRVINYTRPDPTVRMHVLFGVEYGTDVKKVKKIVLEIFENMEGVLKEPAPTVHFTEMGDFALKFKANFWVEKWSLAYDQKLEATEKIYNALNQAKIKIPFPTQTVYLKK